MHFAITSGLLFFIRCFLSLCGCKFIQHKNIKYVTYIIDICLLSLALYLVYILPRAYFYNGWIYLKILLVITYIVLGSFAIKRGKTKTIKIICFILAMLIFIQIYFIAKLKHPFGIFIYLIY